MSRFDDALDAIEQSLADLKEAVDEVKSGAAATNQENGAPSADSLVDEEELRAMKAELGDALQLLQEMQRSAPSQTATQTDEAAS